MSDDNKLSLYGFNNLTKNLSFSLYKVHYLYDDNAVSSYHQHISEHFNSDKLSGLLSKICHAIGGNILSLSAQDYRPHGASVTVMMSEEAQPESLVAHLDKSHLCVHTYPDDKPQDNIAIFRADIELSTCGVISPLKVINYLINEFKADVVDIDYRVRGMTRSSSGKKLFSDESMSAISDYFSPEITEQYCFSDSCIGKQHLFHCKLARKKNSLSELFFGCDHNKLTTESQKTIRTKVELQIKELFNG